jgi:hypothetical protein
MFGVTPVSGSDSSSGFSILGVAIALAMSWDI